MLSVSNAALRHVCFTYFPWAQKEIRKKWRPVLYWTVPQLSAPWHCHNNLNCQIWWVDCVMLGQATFKQWRTTRWQMATLPRAQRVSALWVLGFRTCKARSCLQNKMPREFGVSFIPIPSLILYALLLTIYTINHPCFNCFHVSTCFRSLGRQGTTHSVWRTNFWWPHAPAQLRLDSVKLLTNFCKVGVQMGAGCGQSDQQ